MKKEDKKLLLKDLCARLPYNCRVFYEYVDDLDGKTYGYSLTLNTWCIDELVANKAVIKPYLRPMSSMTEEEKEEFNRIREIVEARLFNAMSKDGFTLAFYELDDWLNRHHFDYRGLIPRSLAVEAPEDMYNLEKK